MVFKKIEKKDFEAASEILVSYWKERNLQGFGKNYAKKYLSKGHLIEIKNDETFLLNEKGKAIGLVSLVEFEGNVSEIRDLFVLPEFREKGFGKRLIKGYEKEARRRKIRKIFTLSLPNARKFYAELGFKKEGLLKNHFKKGENMTVMSKFL